MKLTIRSDKRYSVKSNTYGVLGTLRNYREKIDGEKTARNSIVKGNRRPGKEKKQESASALTELVKEYMRCHPLAKRSA